MPSMTKGKLDKCFKTQQLEFFLVTAYILILIVLYVVSKLNDRVLLYFWGENILFCWIRLNLPSSDTLYKRAFNSFVLI